MFYSIYQHIKYTKLLKKIYKTEDILQNLSKLFGSKFKIDWCGRIYSVLNPYLNNGKYDPTTLTLQYDEDGVSDKVFIENWIMERMLVAQSFIQANNLFDILTYEIENLGNGNYLFILKPITFDEYIKNLKKLFISGCQKLSFSV